MPASSALKIVRCPPSRLLTRACESIVAAHREELPDLTRATVVIPDLYARAAVAYGLSRAAGAPVLMVPRITTLRRWADEATLPAPIFPRPAREAMLHQALGQRRWFDDADLWTIVGELIELFDELTRWHVGMPASVTDFQRRLEEAYRVRAGASFAFEARLVHELWHVSVEGKGQVDAEAAYPIQLAELGRSVDAPVYTLDLETLAPAERDFLDACARRVPTVCFAAERDSVEEMSLPERVLRLAWPVQKKHSLSARAAELKALSAEPVLAGRVRFFGADGIEQEARAVQLSIRRWLQAGCKSIAVVVLDRVTARRARALLERAAILIRDEAGWPFSTTSAATVLTRWFDVCADDFYHRDLLDLLKSPFAFSDWDRDTRQQAVWRLERKLRIANVRTGLENYLALTGSHEDAGLRQILLRVQRAAVALGTRGRKTLARWLDAVAASLDELGVSGGYAADAAGSQLAELLQRWRRDLSQSTATFGFGDFRRWLVRQFESATFQDAAIDSPVVFTSLHATRLRRFDAVLIVGADESRLPGSDPLGVFFNQSVRRELGLPGRAEATRDTEAMLFALLANVPEVLVTWQRGRDAQPNLLSPIFERLRTLHALTWNEPLDDIDLGPRTQPAIGLEASRATAPQPPQPVSPPERLPTAVSASAYNSLLACPYQFFARYVLKLRTQDEVQEELEKADYGSLIHEVLHDFHRAHPRVLDVSVEAARDALAALSEAKFRDVVAVDYLASAWLARWRNLIPSYIDWHRTGEAQGWRVASSEVDRDIVISTPAGRSFRLQGRIDRVDVREADGGVRVIDYKTQSRKTLADKLAEPGEDVQLPVYALLWGGPIASALFLSVDNKKVDPVELEHDVDILAREVGERIGHLYDRLSAGARLPAHGIEAVCQYCEMAGLCRRKHWA